MITALMLSVCVCVPPPDSVDMRRILDSIREVETGGLKNPDKAIGDNGAALGAYQIHYCAWVDACQYDKSLRDFDYQHVTNREYAERVVVAYLSRYVKDWTRPVDSAARTHNGGPKGIGKRATDGYAAKVRRAYDVMKSTKE